MNLHKHNLNLKIILYRIYSHVSITSKLFYFIQLILSLFFTMIIFSSKHKFHQSYKLLIIDHFFNNFLITLFLNIFLCSFLCF